MAGLALYLNVNKSTLYEWVKDGNHKEFSDTLSKLHDYQEVKVVNKSLNGDYNAAISKLILHNHGYSEQSIIDEAESPGLNITFTTKDAVKDIKVTNAKP